MKAGFFNSFLFLSLLGWFGCALNSTVSAQVLRSIPRFPTDTSTVTIIYDASQGNGALAGVAPPIYAHTGVITNLSTSPTDWKYVRGSWGTSNAPLMSPLGNNVYSISYVPRTYYNATANPPGVPASESIRSLAFVFRNTAGTIVGRAADGSDLYLPLYAAGQLHAALFNPSGNNSIVQPGSSLTVMGASSQVCSLSLRVNGAVVATTVGDSLGYVLSFPQPGNYDLILEANSGGAAGVVVRDTTRLVALGNQVAQPLPPGMVEGVNYINDSTVILALYAPFKQHAFVLAPFNDWSPDGNYRMNRTADSSWYWLRLEGLTPGQEIPYQYLVNGSQRVADPFAIKILDPANDRFIPAATYPNLLPYPSGTSGIVSVMQPGAPAYAWQNTGFQRPDPRKLVTYELHVRDFVGSRRYKHVMDSLGYLQALGVNCLSLMPVNEFEGNDSWGYNPSFHLAADKAYGTENDLKALIDSCHGRGIAVVLDVVMNHAFGQSPLAQLWWDAANNRPAANSPYFNTVPKHDFNVGNDFNHESPATRRLLNRVVRHWLTEYRVDGYRFDLSKGFTQTNTLGNTGAWGNYDAARVALWRRVADSMWTLAPNSYVILEHLANNDEEKVLGDYGMLLWGNLNYAFNEGTMGFTTNSSFSWASHKARGWNKPGVMAYAESHDEERLMYKNLLFGAQNSLVNVRNLNTALKRQELVPVFLMSIPGPKMLWQFGEVGYDFSINRCPNGTVNANCRTDAKPVRWDYFTTPERKYLYRIWSAMNQLHKNEPAFATDSFFLAVAGGIKQIRLVHPDMHVVAAGNWDVAFRPGILLFPDNGWYYDYFTGDSVLVTNFTISVNWDPGVYKLYTSRRLSPPNLALGHNEAGDWWETPRYGDLEVYPNPAAEGFTVRWPSTNQEPQSLQLTDVQGRVLNRMQTQHDGQYQWVHCPSWPAGVSPGVYIIRGPQGRSARLIRP